MYMKKTVFSLTRAAYEPPHVAIIEFTVEGGFNLSNVPGKFDENNGTETIVRDDVTDDWYS